MPNVEEIVSALNEQGVPVFRVDGQYIRIENRNGILLSVSVLKRTECLKLHASVDGNAELWNAIHSRAPAPKDFWFDDGPREGRGSVIESTVPMNGSLKAAANEVKRRYDVLRSWLKTAGFFE